MSSASPRGRERAHTPLGLTRPERRRREGLLLGAWLIVLAPLAFALTVSFAVTPEQIESGEVRVAPECSMRRILGHACPTCGLTRAFAALSHGRMGDALGYNRAAVAIYAMWWLGAAAAGIAAARAGLRYASLREDPTPLFEQNASAPEASA